MTKQHGPEPMTDAVIFELHKSSSQVSKDGVNTGPLPIVFARMLEAAVNAQWREWLGKQEPVAWRVLESDRIKTLYFHKPSADRSGEVQTPRTFPDPLYTHPAPKQPWPEYCGSSHCSCVECVAPLSPKHAQVMEQALEALEWANTVSGNAAITALKGALK